MGRPSIYSDEILATICNKLSEGIPLTEICQPDDMPAPRTVRSWMAGDAEEVDAAKVSAAIARAREEGFDALAAECLAIADDGRNDWTERQNKDGSTYEAIDAEHISRSKLRVETRLKLLAKWDPRRYGDRQLLGSDPENPLPAGFAVSLVPAKGDEN